MTPIIEIFTKKLFTTRSIYIKKDKLVQIAKGCILFIILYVEVKLVSRLVASNMEQWTTMKFTKNKINKSVYIFT